MKTQKRQIKFLERREVEQIINAPSVGAMFIVQIRQHGGYAVTKIAGPTPRTTTADGLGEIVV